MLMRLLAFLQFFINSLENEEQSKTATTTLQYKPGLIRLRMLMRLRRVFVPFFIPFEDEEQSKNAATTLDYK